MSAEVEVIDIIWNLSFFALGGCVGVFALRSWQRRKLITLSPRMNMLEARYEMLKAATRRPCVVMLGDSLTAGVPWSEATSCSAVANYGFDGDTSAGVLYRLNEIILLKPRTVFLLVGANDIIKRIPTAETAANVRTIVERLSAEGIAVNVHPVLPFVDAGERVANLNQALTEALSETEARTIPLSVDLSDLRDGLHLAPSGFAKWHEAIKPILQTTCSCAPTPAAAPLKSTA